MGDAQESFSMDVRHTCRYSGQVAGLQHQSFLGMLLRLLCQAMRYRHLPFRAALGAEIITNTRTAAKVLVPGTLVTVQSGV